MQITFTKILRWKRIWMRYTPRGSVHLMHVRYSCVRVLPFGTCVLLMVNMDCTWVFLQIYRTSHTYWNVHIGFQTYSMTVGEPYVLRWTVNNRKNNTLFIYLFKLHPGSLFLHGHVQFWIYIKYIKKNRNIFSIGTYITSRVFRDNDVGERLRPGGNRHIAVIILRRHLHFIKCNRSSFFYCDFLPNTVVNEKQNSILY